MKNEDDDVYDLEWRRIGGPLSGGENLLPCGVRSPHVHHCAPLQELSSTGTEPYDGKKRNLGTERTGNTVFGQLFLDFFSNPGSGMYFLWSG